MELPLVGQTDRTARLDEIKSATSSSVSVSTEVEDTVKISPNSLMVARLLDKVNAMPETRPEVIKEYYARVDSHYPPPLLVDGLTAVVGNALTQTTKAAASSQQAPSE